MTTNASQVSLTLGGILGTTLSGTLDGSTLTLEIPSTPAGTIQTGTLQQATSDDFNRAVAALNGSISQANPQAATQQQASASAQAEQTAQGDLSALQGAAGFSSELGSMSSDVSTIQNDLQTEKNDAAQGPGSDCYGLRGTVDYDVTGTIEYDVNGSFQYDLSQPTNAISVARGDITTLNDDHSSLSASGLPAPSGASAAIASAQQAISAANSDIDSENSVVTHAYAMATGACAGMGPGSPPSPLPHLS
jgi:hypothetical protein